MKDEFFGFEDKNVSNVQDKAKSTDNFSCVNFDMAFSRHKTKSLGKTIVTQNPTNYQMKIKKQFTDVRDYSDIDFLKNRKQKSVEEILNEEKIDKELKQNLALKQANISEPVEKAIKNLDSSKCVKKNEFVFDKEIEFVINTARAGALFD